MIKACHLAQRALIRLQGDDARSFLQGLISNDMQLCQQQHPLYAALLTPQGKFLHDLFIHDHGDGFLIDCEAPRRDDLLTRLQAYKLRAKVILSIMDDLNLWALWGAGAPDYPVDPRHAGLGWRVILPSGQIPEGSEISAFDDYDRVRIGLGVPDGSRDMVVGQSTLSDGNIDVLNGVSWTKGCYVGQELTARMHYRALVKKRLYPVRIDGDPPAFDAPIFQNDLDVGSMRSSCGAVGLALLKCDVDAADQSLTLTSNATTLHLMPK